MIIPAPGRAEAVAEPPVVACHHPGMTDRYVAPGWFTHRVFNPTVAAINRLGVSVWGSRVLEVRGRKSGQPRRTPVNVLAFESQRYLVAPRGDTQWARNLRASGEGRLLIGRRRERFAATELTTRTSRGSSART